MERVSIPLLYGSVSEWPSIVFTMASLTIMYLKIHHCLQIHLGHAMHNFNLGTRTIAYLNCCLGNIVWCAAEILITHNHVFIVLCLAHIHSLDISCACGMNFDHGCLYMCITDSDLLYKSLFWELYKYVVSCNEDIFRWNMK